MINPINPDLITTQELPVVMDGAGIGLACMPRPQGMPLAACDEDIRVEVAMVAIVALERFDALTARAGWVL